MTHDRTLLTPPLLLVQAGLALLAALGLLIYARASNALGVLAVPELVALGGPPALLVLAIGVSRGWRWAMTGVVAWEILTLLGTVVSVLTSRGASLDLTTAFSGIGLPAAIVCMLARPATGARSVKTGFTAGLLLLTGSVHVALVPSHMREAPGLGVLFALDGAVFVFLALASFHSAGNAWRRSTVGLLVATILAYLFMLASKREAVDDLGVATKLIELTALGLVMLPFGTRFNWRSATASVGLLLAIMISGGLTWAASFRPSPTGHVHSGNVALAAAAPTDAQRAAADKLVEDTRLGIQRYAEVQVALADGYRPSTPPLAPTVHYLNPTLQHAGRVLDPTRPEALVYANTPRGPMLLGAMYMLASPNTPVPDLGGPLLEWHTHTNLCFMLATWSIDGLESPFGTCPVGSINAPTPAMLHVWTMANPTRPFAPDLNPAFIQSLNVEPGQ